MDFETKILTPEEWPLVAPVLRGEFACAMPKSPAQASFLAAFDGSELAAFVHVETLFHMNALYVAERHRGAGLKGSRLAMRLAAEADALVPAGFSAVVLSDRPSLARLMRRLGGRELTASSMVRKDY